MTCEYIRDNDVIERYLLGLLDDADRVALEKHLRSCPDCFAEYEEERHLAAAVRKHGRARLKATLREDLQRSRESASKTDWTVYYKIAAMLFILVLLPGIVYYNLNMEPINKIPTVDQSPLVPADSVVQEEKPEEEIKEPKEPEQPVYSDDALQILQEQNNTLESSSPASGAAPEKYEKGEAASSLSRTVAPQRTLKKQTTSEYVTTAAGDVIHIEDPYRRRLRINNRPVDIIFRAGTGSDPGTPEIERDAPVQNLERLNILLPAGMDDSGYVQRIELSVLNDSTIISRFPDSSHYKIQLERDPVMIVPLQKKTEKEP